MSGDQRPARFPSRLAAPSSSSGGTSAPTASNAPITRAPAIVRPVLTPQRTVQHAASLARLQRTPEGVGLDSAGVRACMVGRLHAGGIRHPALLDAMRAVPRHLFVDSALTSQAYEDTSLPIGHGQTISKPSVVARMIELLLSGPNAAPVGHLGRCLEIGTGCGYQAAVLALLSRRLVSIERLKPLHDRARHVLESHRGRDTRLVFGDGMLGHPPHAPYDSIIAAAGGEQIPQAWLDQLGIGGRLVAPVMAERGRQVLAVVDRTEHGWQQHRHETVQFVPLKPGYVL